MRMLFAAVLLVVATGCSTIHAANQVGGEEASTWVFIRQSGWSDPGVFRCVEKPEGPVCTRATLK